MGSPLPLRTHLKHLDASDQAELSRLDLDIDKIKAKITDAREKGDYNRIAALDDTLMMLMGKHQRLRTRAAKRRERGTDPGRYRSA